MSTLIKSNNSNSAQLKPFTEEDFTVKQAEVTVGRELGRGNFSRVFKGTYLDKTVAVKQQELVDADLERYLLNELAVLRLIHHSGCIAFFGAFKSASVANPGTTVVNILTEYLEGGDLRRLVLDKSVPLGWKYRTRIALGVAQALAHMHSLELVHRDIKTENVLISSDGMPKLCDFGFARKWNKNKQMTMCGTDEFMAPEIYFGMQYDEKVDIFSFGILMAELLTRRAPGKQDGFLDRDASGGFEVNVTELEEATANCPQSLVLLTKECVQAEAHNRLSASDAAAWLEDFLKEQAEDVEPMPVLNSEVLRDKLIQYLDKEAEENGRDDDDDDDEHVPVTISPPAVANDHQNFFVHDPALAATTTAGSGGNGSGFFASLFCGGKGERGSVRGARGAHAKQEMGGWVTKRGGRIKTWKRRYMVITTLGIVYFKSPEEYSVGGDAQGQVTFQEMTAVAGVVCNAVPTVMTGKPHSFGVHTGERTYYVAAANAEERGKWIRAITEGHRLYHEQQKKKPVKPAKKQQDKH